MVLGPAQDGGYYLIGMRKQLAPLFTGINNKPMPWSTSEVYNYSVNICKQLDISYSTALPLLSDIDEPQDIPLWTKEKKKHIKEKKISVVVPVLNEEDGILHTLQKLCNSTNTEIIVVDGGSTDSTVSIVANFKRELESGESGYHPSVSLKLLHSAKGRAIQQNTGAAMATGDIFLFVHGE